MKKLSKSRVGDDGLIETYNGPPAKEHEKGEALVAAIEAFILDESFPNDPTSERALALLEWKRKLTPLAHAFEEAIDEVIVRALEESGHRLGSRSNDRAGGFPCSNCEQYYASTADAIRQPCPGSSRQ